MGLRDRAKNAKIVEDTNIYLSEPQKGLELCSNILSVGKVPFQDALDRIDTILNEFMSLSQNDTNKMGVKVYKELMAIREDIVNLLSFSKLENHYTIAVGGGFSSGKSTFLNQVLSLKNVLPTDTNPTTSISSYITYAKKESFVALNNFNNIIELDKDAIQAISHAFHKKYNLSFSHILKLISIETPELSYKNVVFLDTPGYSKSDEIDEDVAREHLRNTDFLIWLVDSQTSIPNSDLQFIKSLNLYHPILVVINKADKRVPKDLEALVSKTKESLNEKKIPFYNVVAYSSSKDKEYSSTQNVIKTYIETIATKEVGTKVINAIDKVFKLYVNYYDSQLLEYRVTREILNEMIMKEAIEDDYLDRIVTLNSKKIKQIKEIETNKKAVLKLQSDFYEIIEELLVQYGINKISYKQEYIFDKEFYKNKNSFKTPDRTFRFPASIHIQDMKSLICFKDVDEIEAKVYKISSIGVFVRITGVEGDIMISKNKILKEDTISNIHDVFKVDDKVLVQILKNKQCIVIK
jgi:GTPase Era involved in 16S rRNA processing